MAREKPLDVAIVQTWLAAWGGSELFSDAAVHHLQSLIAHTHCLVVITLGVGQEPRSLVFRRVKRVLEADHAPGASSSPTIKTDRWPWAHSLSLARSMFVGPVAPVAPTVGQLWHQTGVKSERVPKLERVLRWEGADWVVAGYVLDSPIIVQQGKQTCDFKQALANAHEYTKWFDCEFIYTYDGSTWGNA
jgi:hypothetical protein